MPFFDTHDQNTDINIAYDHYQPITVFAFTDMDGKIRPLRFKYTDKEEMIQTLDIDKVLYAKDILGGVSFSCLVTNYGRQKQVKLVYYYSITTWFLEV